MTGARDAALDGALDKLRGGAPHTAPRGGGSDASDAPDANSRHGDSASPTEAQPAPAPLRFDGHRWDRTGRGECATDAFGNQLPIVPIGPAWWIESLNPDQTWAAEPAPVPRAGLCLDVEHTEEGEPLYICLEEHADSAVVYLHRLDVAADDVNMACPGDRHVKPLRQRVMQALGGSRAVKVGHDTDAEWLAGTFATLGVLVRRRTGRA